MNKLYFTKKTEIYDKYLQSISDIKLTSREVDVVSCILHNRGEKKIASILNISPRTVGTHIRNILNKLGHSRIKDAIIDLVEKSGKVQYVKEYYFELLLNDLLVRYLKKIATINTSVITFSLAINNLTENESNLLKNLIGLLKLANIELQQEKNYKPSCNLYVINNSLIKKDIIDSNDSIGLVFNQDINLSLLDGLRYIDFRINDSYHSIFKLLEQIIDNSDLQSISQNFFLDYELLQNNSNEFAIFNKVSNSSQPFNIKNNKITILKITILILTIIVIILLFNKVIYRDYKKIIKSDLFIPTKTAFLNRDNIIKKIDNIFIKGTNSEIDIISVVGMAGTGKTTIARYFAQYMSDSDLIWELNAETKDTLVKSLYNLSYKLANSEISKKEFIFLQQIENKEIQEKLLLDFINTQLQSFSNWLLIYDNVENFTSINNLLPQNFTGYSNGKVIITTRNENIRETIYINPQNIIYIDKLQEDEKFTLFSKILYDGLAGELDIDIKNKVIEFIQKIPPFPLDISIAAYYIKNTNISFDQYINHINTYCKDYNSGFVREAISFLK